MNTRETIIDALRKIATDKRMLRHSDYWALICGEAADLLEKDAEGLWAQEPQIMDRDIVTKLKIGQNIILEDRRFGLAMCYVDEIHDWRDDNGGLLIDVYIPMAYPRYHGYGDHDYGKRWRIWSQIPTEKQREATPWKQPI